MPPRANSCRFALPRISAPALRIFATVKASAERRESFMPTLPPVVGMSAVLKLSLSTIGMQCKRAGAARIRLVLPIHLGRRLHRLRIDSDDGAERRTPQIVGLDPVEIEPGQLRAGQLPAGERRVNAGDGRLLKMKRRLRRRGRCHAKHCTDRRHLDEMAHHAAVCRPAALESLNVARQRTYELTAEIGVGGATACKGQSATQMRGEAAVIIGVGRR